MTQKHRSMCEASMYTKEEEDAEQRREGKKALLSPKKRKTQKDREICLFF